MKRIKWLAVVLIIVFVFSGCIEVAPNPAGESSSGNASAAADNSAAGNSVTENSRLAVRYVFPERKEWIHSFHLMIVIYSGL